MDLLGYGAIRATAHTKFANFASNLASLLTFAVSGHISVAARPLMGAGQFFGARLGTHAILRGGACLIRPLLNVIRCTLAIRVALTTGNPLAAVLLPIWLCIGR